MTTLQRSAAEELRAAQQALADRQIATAIDLFLRAEERGASPSACSAGRWQAYMLSGEFAKAWRESDGSRQRRDDDPHRLWEGSSVLARRVIVRCLHGFGDTIQFLPYVARLHSVASHTIVEVPPRLFDLASTFFAPLPETEVITWGVQAPQTSPEWEVQLEIMELPYLFRTTLPDLPLAVNYYQPPAWQVDEVSHTMGTRRLPRVGVAWAAGEWNPSRSMPASALAPLAALPAELWSLQQRDRYCEAASFFNERELRDSSQLGDGIVPLAATIANLDLVISVDTLVVHLAAAMGKTVWLLLEFAADWRWMGDRSDSPWYPSLRIFRQERDAGWIPLVDHVAAELQTTLKGLA